MLRRRTLRRLIWASLALQLGGLLFDAVWHGTHPEFAPATRDQMIAHLRMVHLPIYLGVFCVVLTTVLALIRQIDRDETGAALGVALAGALVSAAGEGWHAYTHLQLGTHAGPIAASVSLLGFLVVVGAMWQSRRRAGRRPADDVDQRRAA